ncbi:anti-sigma factor antagonist [Streptomyces sp. NPDC002677]|uniref:anti-sigma factor antagonist n=1 Tax=Streptomyces sp. NPDC002677 TaxID=3154774 RepID=UPI003323659F
MHAIFERTVHVPRHEQILMITVSGEVDYVDAVESAAARDVTDPAGCPPRLRTRRWVVYAESTLLNALLVATHRHAAAGRDLLLLGPLRPAVTRLLTVNGTLDRFTIASTGPRPPPPVKPRRSAHRR